MRTSTRTWVVSAGVSLVFATVASAAPRRIAPQQFTSVDAEPPDIVGDSRIAPPVSKAASDTLWIADWSFDSAGGCTSAGWSQYDNRILNGGGNPSGLEVSGHIVWTQVPDYSGQGLIAGNAAKLGIHNLCWQGDGYGDNWDYGIRLMYRGDTTLDFDFKCDTEVCCDLVTVEPDNGCSSFSKLDYTARPGWGPSDYRTTADIVVSGVPHRYFSGNTGAGSLHATCSLPGFGAPGTTNCAYIRFAADASWSHEDGLVASAFGAGLVVDNIALTGGAISYTEDFSGTLDPNVTFMNLNPSLPFGTWARLYQHVTDNDKCTENTTCAWLWTDPTLIAVDASVSYGPGRSAIRNWLDDIIVSPWVSLGSTSNASSTVLSFRRFFGNFFTWSKIAQNWSIRSHGKVPNTDTVDPSDSLDCITPWAHAGSWSTGSISSGFTWLTSIAPMTQYVAPGAREIQLRWRLSDWQYLTGDYPGTLRVGPGPYNDRMRIGRRTLVGPVIDEGTDARSQAQDGFATVPLGGAAGEHFVASNERFGTCAFSMSGDLAIGRVGPRLVVGDSISVGVMDARGAGGITAVYWYGTIVSGPHAGKAPAPYAVGANGFFSVSADSVRSATGATVAGKFFVDLDDTYFRGGDVLEYFWCATDAGGGFTSDPEGMAALPASRAEAEAATGGLLEVSFLPEISWAPSYLARIAADTHGDLDPTPDELAASHQAHCILYDELVNFRRLSGQLNRTSMMYTLERLGYRGAYDTYDQMGYGNTNNQVGGRASVQQAVGYALIIQDNGRGLSLTLPDGISIDSEKVNQAQWYRDWLANGSLSEIGTASLWIVSENTVNEKRSNPLIATDMGITLVSNDQGLGSNPNVEGQTPFTWANGGVTSFVGDGFALNGGCPTIRNYDALGASGSAVITHKYKAGATLGAGAVVMNRNVSLHWNTLLSSFAWFDIRDVSGTSSGSPPYPDPTSPSPEAVLMTKVFANTLPSNCQRAPNPTAVETALPKVTALFQNVPNPFNPTTMISLDLAQQGQVEIRLFDVTGRLVRTLLDAALPAGRHEVLWNGLDDAGRKVSSGVYFYRLEAGDFTAMRKLVVLR